MSLVKNRPSTTSNVTSTELLDFTLARYIRIRLQGMHTTISPTEDNNIQWLVDQTELNIRSFYSLRFIKIGARLDCGGHAYQAKYYNAADVCIKNNFF